MKITVASRTTRDQGDGIIHPAQKAEDTHRPGLRTSFAHDGFPAAQFVVDFDIDHLADCLVSSVVTHSSTGRSAQSGPERGW